MSFKNSTVLFSLLAVLILFNSFFIVDDREKAIVIQFGETVREDVMDVILLVDAREVSAVGGGKDTPLELSCRAAATYAKQLLDERNNVALMVY